ncbi:MAG: hypothetical protein RIC80_04885 [Cyclobacteriaceae bacterium]
MEHPYEYLGFWIIITPLIIMVVMLVGVTFSMIQQKINLNDLLMEPDVKLPDPKPGATEENDQKESPKRSTSRFILFLTSVTTLFLALNITSYYFYMKIYAINTSQGLSLDEFANVLLALGIGVVPYAVNQVKKIRL